MCDRHERLVQRGLQRDRLVTSAHHVILGRTIALWLLPASPTSRAEETAQNKPFCRLLHIMSAIERSSCGHAQELHLAGDLRAQPISGVSSDNRV